MSKEFYFKLYKPFYKDKNKRKTLNILDKIVTYSIYFSFPLFAIILFINKHDNVLRLLLTTSISFLLLSLCRKIFNTKRPYEIFNIKPILYKDTKGKSFPSRHVFSAFVIGTSSLYIYPLYGSIVLGLGFILAIIRVVGGVHFIKDVTFGAILGILCAVAGFLF